MLGPAPLPSPFRRPTPTQLSLIVLPTLAVLGVYFLLETLAHHQLLFTSLASSAVIIYLNPSPIAGWLRTLLLAQGTAATLGYGLAHLLGAGYPAAALAVALTLTVMVLFRAIHPPAASTALGFAFQPGPLSSVLYFALAVGLLAALVALQQAGGRLLRRPVAPPPAP